MTWGLGMTQLEFARKGKITPQMQAVANDEGVDATVVMRGIADGKIVVFANERHAKLKPCGVGWGLRTKVNANIGTSPDFGDIKTELEKLQVAVKYQADTIMDLSIGRNIIDIRKVIIEGTSLPVGTVPIYQAAIQTTEKRGAIVNMTADDIFNVIEEQAQDGVDFMTVHCGVTQDTANTLKSAGRTTGIVSRGGAFLVGWMLHNGRENPLFQEYDRLLAIARKYDVTLSLGDGMRPGSLADATDSPQLKELLILGNLVQRARSAGVQVIVEGPGHLPLDHIIANVKLEKSICKGAPFYVLGPLVTDIAAGYDHIAGAIGGAIAAMEGADFLCYVTPAEHLSLPDPEDVKQGVIASRIAANAADIIKGVGKARERSKEMSLARENLDWQRMAELSLDAEKVNKEHARHPSQSAACSMCGAYCAINLVKDYLGNQGENKC